MDVPGLRDLSVAIEKNRKIDRCLFYETAHARVGLGDGNGEHLHMRGVRSLGESAQGGKFLPAWLAPCCEEMHYDDAALLLTERDNAAVEILKDEIRLPGALPGGQFRRV